MPSDTTAIEAATSQVGLPYVWGAEKPGGAFDCSGLVQFAELKAGVVGFPRTTTTQWAWARAHNAIVSPSDAGGLQPGDLLYYNFANDGPAPNHVAMYIGGGKMVQAADPALGIFIGPVSTQDLYGVVRP